MRNSTIVCPVKMEYVPEINIFVLKMMMKSGLENIILKFLHAQNYFFLLHKNAQNCNFKLINLIFIL